MRSFDLPAADDIDETEPAQPLPTVVEASADEVVVLPRALLNLGTWRPANSNDLGQPVMWRAHVRVGRAAIVPLEALNSLVENGEAIATPTRYGERPQLFTKVAR